MNTGNDVVESRWPRENVNCHVFTQKLVGEVLHVNFAPAADQKLY